MRTNKLLLNVQIWGSEDLKYSMVSIVNNTVLYT